MCGTGQGRHDEALDHYQAALRLAREIGEQYQEGMVLDGITFGQLGVPEAEAVRIRLDILPPEQS